MTKNNKGRNGGDRATPKTGYSQDYTELDTPIGPLNHAKPSRNRQQKREWQRGLRK